MGLGKLNNFKIIKVDRVGGLKEIWNENIGF